MGKSTSYPEMPCNYFDHETGNALAEFRRRAGGNSGTDLLTGFPEIDETTLTRTWHKFAVQIYTNWLSYLVKQRGSTHRPPISEASMTRVTACT
jgi:hypothetical protein